ncbi:PaaI family thioesterase [Fontimonas sp. SYSU GA230001]|uniref:PaaI family thioesterase n=1 Tax=Fontimonas sp. SYSU GA230001 TaxID=3142450 RepID=UPI0032B5F349
MELKFDAAGTQALIRGGVRVADKGGLVVEDVRQGYARIRLPFRDSMLRPGNVISGPALFTAADSAMYALVLSHLGPALMAVTANMNLAFLNKALPGDVIGEARLLKLGRKLVVMSVELFTSADPQRMVAHVTGSYALPGA